MIGTKKNESFGKNGVIPPIQCMYMECEFRGVPI